MTAKATDRMGITKENGQVQADPAMLKDAGSRAVKAGDMRKLAGERRGV